MTKVFDFGGGTRLICGETLDEVRQQYPPGETFAIARPLVRNVPEGKPGWEVVACDRCDERCWKRVGIEPDPPPAGTFFCCTACALRAGAARSRQE